LADKYAGEGLVLFSVSYDDSAAHVERFFREKDFSYPVVLDDREKGATGKVYQVGGIPTLFLIDRDGKIVEKRVGYDSRHAAELAACVEALVRG
jgi:peroxiredoxin